MAILAGKRLTAGLLMKGSARGGVRNLADRIGVDYANPEDPMSPLAVVMLAVVGRLERTCASER